MKDLKVLKKLSFKVRRQNMFVSEKSLNGCLLEQDLYKNNAFAKAKFLHLQVQVQENFSKHLLKLHVKVRSAKKQSLYQNKSFGNANKASLWYALANARAIAIQKNEVSVRTCTCTCIRPLLNLKRASVTMACKDFKMPVYPDQSNKSVQYSRNRIRKQIIPSIKYFINLQVENSLFKLAELLTKEQLFLYSILRNTSSNLLL